ncbi:hypothetical protein [Algibacter sp. Ld11]|uniref:hypothetical protein n=1 Tax=Algibacter sp. Ld11 TaxID=649150 RepID=UPI00386B94D9
MSYRLLIILLFITSGIGWAQKTEILPDLINKVELASNTLEEAKPNHMDPLALKATLVWSEDKSQLAIIMKATLLEGWHIYAYVPETQPYIATDMRLILPKGITKIKDWENPYSTPYENGIYIYEGSIVFVQYCSVNSFNKDDVITSGLYYQTCDIRKCFPPETKTISLVLD